MIHIALILAAAVTCSAQPGAKTGQAAADSHEAAENKAWTVEGGASKGVLACHDDIESFCKAVKPGRGRLGKCLKKNDKKLSKDCRAWLEHGGKAHVDRAYQELDESGKAPAKK
jgi:hypothetical protein